MAAMSQPSKDAAAAAVGTSSSKVSTVSWAPAAVRADFTFSTEAGIVSVALRIQDGVFLFFGRWPL